MASDFLFEGPKKKKSSFNKTTVKPLPDKNGIGTLTHGFSGLTRPFLELTRPFFELTRAFLELARAFFEDSFVRAGVPPSPGLTSLSDRRLD